MALRRSPAALADVDAIWEYIHEYDPAAADRLVTQFTDAADCIEGAPFVGAVREHVARTARGMLVGSYMMLYRIDGDDVEIVRVVHAARDMRTFAADFDAP